MLTARYFGKEEQYATRLYFHEGKHFFASWVQCTEHLMFLEPHANFFVCFDCWQCLQEKTTTAMWSRKMIPLQGTWALLTAVSETVRRQLRANTDTEFWKEMKQRQLRVKRAMKPTVSGIQSLWNVKVRQIPRLVLQYSSSKHYTGDPRPWNALIK